MSVGAAAQLADAQSGENRQFLHERACSAGFCVLLIVRRGVRVSLVLQSLTRNPTLAPPTNRHWDGAASDAAADASAAAGFGTQAAGGVHGGRGQEAHGAPRVRVGSRGQHQGEGQEGMFATPHLSSFRDRTLSKGRFLTCDMYARKFCSTPRARAFGEDGMDAL